MPQAIGHEEAWQAVTLSAKVIKTIDLIIPPSWADALPARDPAESRAESRAGSVPAATTTAAGRAIAVELLDGRRSRGSDDREERPSGAIDVREDVVRDVFDAWDKRTEASSMRRCGSATRW
ncbi:hypothetical protein ACWDV7_34945 [Streptomyces sp. NPDC003362]